MNHYNGLLILISILIFLNLVGWLPLQVTAIPVDTTGHFFIPIYRNNKIGIKTNTGRYWLRNEISNYKISNRNVSNYKTSNDDISKYEVLNTILYKVWNLLENA